MLIKKGNFSFATDSHSLRRRQRDRAVLKTALDRLIRESAEVAGAIDEAVGAVAARR